MSEEQSLQLKQAVLEHETMIVSGITGSGKTTLLRTLIQIAVDAGERVLIIEDTPELNVPGKRVLQWEAATKRISMRKLLRQALRHRPDRIVVGEVRGPEALELVRACNTGHAGLLATLHSNGGKDTLRRLHTLVCEKARRFKMAGIKSAIDLDVHLTGRGSERRLAPLHHFKR